MGMKVPSVVEGFFEGLFAPIIEYIVATFIVIGQEIEKDIISISNVPTPDLVGIFGLFFLFEFIRNFVIGAVAPFTGAAYVVGAILGLILFASIASAIGGSVIFGAFFVIVGMVIRGGFYLSAVNQYTYSY